jgi:phosphoserine phosphatase RsbU/P
MRTYNFILNSSLRRPYGASAGKQPPIKPVNLDRPADRARRTQRLMWPSARPSVPGLEYHAGWHIGAGPDVDYLDYFETDGGNFSLAIGDVVAGSGDSGAPGALLISSMHAMVRSLDEHPSEQTPGRHLNLLGDLVHTIHELFYEVAPEGSYATLFLARYDPIERRLDYCNAGHEAPMLLRKSGGRRRLIRLESGGPLVGVLRRSSYRQVSVRLQPGDILAAYTAGLAECRDRRGEEWGQQHLFMAIEEAAELPVHHMVEHVLGEAEAFASPARCARDMTLWLGRVDEALSLPEPLLAESVETADEAALAA